GDFYKEAFRLLQPGGRLIIADCIRAQSLFYADETLLAQQWFDLDTWEEHQNNMICAGFSRVHIEDITALVETKDNKLRRSFKPRTIIDQVLKKIKIKWDFNFQPAFIKKPKEGKSPERLWSYGLLFAIKPAIR